MWSWEYDGQPTEENALPWGEMAIDVYLIENWEESSPMDNESQYDHLVQKFFALGELGREQYIDNRTITPTQDQIDGILKPFRSMYYRALASVLQSGICLRLDYSDDERSHAFWKEELNSAVTDIFTVVVDDKNEFGVYDGACEAEGDHAACFTKVLRLLPEIVTKIESISGHLALEEMRDWSKAVDKDELEITEIAVRNYLVSGTIFVEDLRTHSDERDENGRKMVLQVLFDIYGNVISSMRVPVADAVAINDWHPVPREGFQITYSEDLGVHYASGGKFAPPYTQVLDLESGVEGLRLEMS